MTTDKTNTPLTIRELQKQLPWTIHYDEAFRNSPVAHKDFQHALLHVFKAAGKLASAVNDAEHKGHLFKSVDIDPYLADLVICALRMANTCPRPTGRQPIDLQTCVEERIEMKNGMKLDRGVAEPVIRDRTLREFASLLIAPAWLSNIIEERDNQGAKYGVTTDDGHDLFDWVQLIVKHATRALDVSRITTPPLQRGGIFRFQMVRVAALAVAAIEAIDRKTARQGPGGFAKFGESTIVEGRSHGKGRLPDHES